MAAIAVVLARRRRGGGGGLAPTPREHISEDRRKEIDAHMNHMKETKVLCNLFRQYDTNKSNKLEADNVKNLLRDLNGVDPTEEELEFIMKLCDDQCANSAIDLSELKHAIIAWMDYCKNRDKMQEALDKYDKSGTGKLEREELKAYLVELNGGIDVTDYEVDWVLAQADVFGDGACSKPELAKATAAWFTYVEERKRKGCCVVS
eukprot:CAMPEP_0177332350 /NCGR_PEP_ID=MMETSP0368-20130122/21544_1 /TAXON_ID=447022 ORGANISM="Scrippsiella hangoei-like, Strain SHHI-4" /NCGR_SAMPLE_ID=MMETSP0368 /ASSEMBLY_ACC=CAM_ASM_000363 /LENGTH=204 /DNA_ID=CAMNT_0018792807 /DNA_START=10 /DNA_END=624 /DNA_ORIENTATION=-